MKIAFLDIPVVSLILFFLISSFISIDRWASFAGSFGVWHDGFFVFFFLVVWYFLAARFLKVHLVWRLGFILPILFMFLLGILSKSFAVAFLGLSALLFFHIARLKRDKKPLVQGNEVLLIASLLLFLGVLGAFPISSLLPQFLPLQESMLDSWQVALSSVGASFKNFLLGTGPGTFPLDVAKYSITGSVKGTGLAEVLATFGILGFALYSILFSLVFFRFALSAFFKNDRDQAFLAASTLALFGAYLLSPASLALSLVFWTLAALARQQTHIIPNRVRPFWKLGVLVLAGLVCFWGFRAFAGQIVFQKARTEPSVTNQVSLLETAKKLNPYEAAYNIALGKLYLNQAREDTDSPQAAVALENALLNLRQATLMSPARFEAWEALGVLYKEIQGAPGATEWGLKAFETAISLSPNNPRLYTELGMLYLDKEQFEDAKDQFEKALALSPGFADALLWQALLQEKEGNPDKALSLLEKLSLDNPLRGDILFQLGRMYYNKGRLQDAEVLFRRVLLLSLNNSNAHYSLGLLYEKQKKKKQAIEEFKKVLELNPNDSNVIVKLNQLTK